MDRPIHLDASTTQQGDGFAYAMRNALRRDPAIITIGEASDPETINAVSDAERTGHLISNTMHTRSAI